MFAAEEFKVALTLHTDAYIIRGQVSSRQRRVTDILNDVDHDFLVLTDAEIATMTRWFQEHTISEHGRYRVVEPTIVVEVAFDVILRSNRHKSGFALRFPRIAHLRTDKSADEIDTLATVRMLYEGLQQGAEHLVTAGARK